MAAAPRDAAVARMPLDDDAPDPSDGIAGRLDDAARVERALRAIASMPDRDQELEDVGGTIFLVLRGPASS